MTVAQLLCSQRRWGAIRTQKALRLAQVSQHKELCRLTERQIRVLLTTPAVRRVNVLGIADLAGALQHALRTTRMQRPAGVLNPIAGRPTVLRSYRDRSARGPARCPRRHRAAGRIDSPMAARRFAGLNLGPDLLPAGQSAPLLDA
jgi:hypothetical protein